jgi:REP element-mobilizing transposase RayT
MPTELPALGYLITWTTYGAWLSGDKRGWVKAGKAGVQAPNGQLEDKMRERMAANPVVLMPAHRAIVEQTVTAHCRFRQWRLHAVNARTNHVHVVVTADRDPNEIMEQLKAWCSRKLSDAAGLTDVVAVKAGRRRWFTEGGDTKSIHDELHLQNAIRYILKRQ